MTKSDDLVKRLREGAKTSKTVMLGGVPHDPRMLEAADRIKELEANLAKALETLEYFSNGKHIRGDTPADACQWVINHARATIEELKGQDQ